MLRQRWRGIESLEMLNKHYSNHNPVGKYVCVRFGSVIDSIRKCVLNAHWWRCVMNCECIMNIVILYIVPLTIRVLYAGHPFDSVSILHDLFDGTEETMARRRCGSVRSVCCVYVNLAVELVDRSDGSSIGRALTVSRTAMQPNTAQVYLLPLYCCSFSFGIDFATIYSCIQNAHIVYAMPWT